MVVRGGTLIPVEQDIPLLPGEKPQAYHVPHALARVQPLHGGDPVGGGHGAEDHRRDDAVPALGAGESRHRSRPGRLHGNQEAGRLFLSAVTLDAANIESFLRQNEEKELLRLSTAGSVDDGKSTLIGRLLYDSKGVYEDQIASVRKASVNQSAGTLDFALLTDGLRAEREQGITIDVAYRYFSTPKRKFIIADTPGHEQYTRNMATGASTANLAIILVDARNGVLPQSRRHAYIASLLGIPHVVVAVNKMDLVGLPRGCLRLHPPRFFRLRRTAGDSRSALHPHQRAAWRQRGRAQRAHALVRWSEPAALSGDPSISAPTRT